MKRHFSDYVYSPALSGETVSTGGMLRAEVYADVIKGKVEQMLTGLEAVNVKPMEALEYRFQAPEQDTISLQRIQEGARADYETITWFDIGGTLEKYQQALSETDEVKIRQLEELQSDVQINACAQGFALERDKNIFSKLNGAAGNTTALDNPWTDTIAANVAEDIAYEVGQLLKTTKLGINDISKIKFFYPVELHGYLHTPVQIGTREITIKDFVTSTYGITFVPNKYFETDGLMVYKDDLTAFHAVYTGKHIPTAESERVIGSGQRYIFTHYFQTVVLPDNRNTLTSGKIRKITGLIPSD